MAALTLNDLAAQALTDNGESTDDIVARFPNDDDAFNLIVATPTDYSLASATASEQSLAQSHYDSIPRVIVYTHDFIYYSEEYDDTCSFSVISRNPPTDALIS